MMAERLFCLTVARMTIEWSEKCPMPNLPMLIVILMDKILASAGAMGGNYFNKLTRTNGKAQDLDIKELSDKCDEGVVHHE